MALSETIIFFKLKITYNFYSAGMRKKATLIIFAFLMPTLFDVNAFAANCKSIVNPCYFDNMPDQELCLGSTKRGWKIGDTYRSWKSDKSLQFTSIYRHYLQEAKRRGLNCQGHEGEGLYAANASKTKITRPNTSDQSTEKIQPPTSTEKPNIEPKQNSRPSNNNQIVTASSGSGFAVSATGHVVTNHHVIEGCQKVFVHRKGRKFQTDIISFDAQNDLALLKGNFRPDIVLPLTTNKPQLAQDIYVSGYPFGLNISSSVKVKKGIISSLTGIGNNLAEMQIDAALQSGNSGGPILDEYGNLVGVAVAKLDVKFALKNFGAIPENTNFGVKANIVEALLDANGVNYKQGKAEKPSGAEFSNILSNGTYYISCWMTLAQIEAMKTKKVMFGDLQ